MQFSPGYNLCGVIITTANSKDGRPCGVPNMIAPWRTSIFLYGATSAFISDPVTRKINCILAQVFTGRDKCSTGGHGYIFC